MLISLILKQVGATQARWKHVLLLLLNMMPVHYSFLKGLGHSILGNSVYNLFIFDNNEF